MFILSTVFVFYISIVFLLSIYSYSCTKNFHDYILGNRTLNSVLVAFGACASDMGSWMLLALPGAVMLHGFNQIWLPIGLLLGMYFNWRFVAKRMRIYTEKVGNALTVSKYLGNRFLDNTGYLEMTSAVITLIFFTCYSASGLTAGALLFESIFGIEYSAGVLVTSAVVVLYTCLGGFLAISWIDLFQGSVMLIVLVFLPVTIVAQSGGLSFAIMNIIQYNPCHYSIFYQTSFLDIISLLSWGLGYFGQPHILARFMAAKNIKIMFTAQCINILWMLISLSGAVLTGFFSIAYFFPNTLANPETLFIVLSQKLFSPYFSGILIAVLFSAVMSTTSAQLLTSVSAIIEHLSTKNQLWIGRLLIVLVGWVATYLALHSSTSIIHLVGYAWAGLGASFGPVVLVSLFWKRMTLLGAYSGIIVGALTVILWPIFFPLNSGYAVYEILPAFLLSSFSIYIATMISPPPLKKIIDIHHNIKKFIF